MECLTSIATHYNDSTESLEYRLCPSSLTVRLSGSTLYISGDSASGIINLIQSKFTGNIQVLDNASNLGTYAVSDISLRTANAPETVNLTLAKNETLSGNVSLTTGNGPDTVSVNGNILGQIAGNLAINTGPSTDQASIGATSGLVVGGNVTLQGSGSDNFAIEGGTVIGGNLSATSPTGNFLLGGSGDGAAVKGNVTINGTGSHDVTVTSTPTATVGGNFQCFTGGSSQVTLGGNILGNVNVTEAGSSNSLTVNTATTVGGSLTYTGSGTNSVNLSGPLTIGGDVALNLGNGDNNYLVGPMTSINGSLQVNAGNGTNNGTLRNTINDNLSINVGNGDNILIVANAPGGVLSWTSGNGTDSLMLGNMPFTNPSEIWNVNARFGAGSDNFALSGAVPPTQFLTGFVDMGGPAGANTFDPAHALGVNWQVLGPFTLQNV